MNDSVKKYKAGALRANTNKPPTHLITKQMIDGLAAGLKLGQERGYPDRNWEQGFSIVESCLGSALRHIFEYIDGEDMNLEKNFNTGEDCTPVHHLDCAFSNLGMAVTFIRRGRTDLDDRPSVKAEDDTATLDKHHIYLELTYNYLKTINNLDDLRVQVRGLVKVFGIEMPELWQDFGIDGMRSAALVGIENKLENLNGSIVDE